MNKFFYTVAVFVMISFSAPLGVSAHCDTLNGPVVNAARRALNTENVNYAVVWVKQKDEDDIVEALKKAIEKRKKAKTQEEKNSADMEFFETLARIHREGEGVQYEGIKPANLAEPEIVLADEAVETGDLEGVLKHVQSSKNKEILTHFFHEMKEAAVYDIDDVSAGRRFVRSYVTFIHAVEKAMKGENLHAGEIHEHGGQ